MEGADSFTNMSKADILRGIIATKLKTAAQEIFVVVERTVAAYEEEASGFRREIDRQRSQLDALLQPRVKLERRDVQLQSASKDEVPAERQEWRPSLDKNNQTGLPMIKEEQEELWTNQEVQQLQGLEEADITRFAFTPVPVKSDENHKEKPQSSQFPHTEEMQTEADREDYGGPDPDRNFDPLTRLQSDTGDVEKSGQNSGSNSLRNNEETQCKPGKSPVISSECSASFGLQRRLQEHGGTQTAERTFSCSICGKKYERKRNLTDHMGVHLEEKRFSCSICKEAFQLMGDFVMHMRIHAGETPVASVRGARFAQNERLKNHTEDKPFSCSVCGARFARKENLKQHTRTHTGEKPFRCSLCGKGFALSGNLNQHMRIHTGEKPFSCSVCRKSFTRHSYLKHHKCISDY